MLVRVTPYQSAAAKLFLNTSSPSSEQAFFDSKKVMRKLKQRTAGLGFQAASKDICVAVSLPFSGHPHSPSPPRLEKIFAIIKIQSFAQLRKSGS